MTNHTDIKEGGVVVDDDTSATESPHNATVDDLETLNGLLVRRLINKINDGTATSTDLGTAMQVCRSHKIQPDTESEAAVPHNQPHHRGYHFDHHTRSATHRDQFAKLDFPVDVDAPDYKG